ncbi:ModD protein [Beijerinckia indica]|uniref:Putative pyrophosphorylase ModD n=1 Tax=Beijerinckia indica subsp. indica (strain ATCC 9039 / DSM 1715 / NCIMB 8712) TaxID=395963 RepID=B2ID76_BEII9|nr:ModD protein [Beijerinckia indica]ACB93933.1 modD protein [Beijerinckia indica subsp. indica ATCC 9039]
MILPILPDHVLDQLLADDSPLLDLTTHVLALDAHAGEMHFAARDPMVAACVEEAARIIERAGAKVVRHAASGDRLVPKAPILTAQGPAPVLLRAWKVSQNLIEVASGIATATAALVDAARAVRPNIAVTCTRKAVPGTKLISLKAILAGGALPHRLGLSETILIFAEHRAFLSGQSEQALVEQVRREAAEKKIVVEVASVEEALAWAKAGADVIQAEKFSPAAIISLVEAVGSLQPKPVIAAAGGINAENAGLYAAAGADVLVTSSPYWGKPRDVAVTLGPAILGQ